MKLEDYFRIKGKYELIDGAYNVKGSVRLIKQVEKLPCKFGKVSNYFDCSNNKLTSLEGCPISIGDFWCDGNNLTSLEGCPTIVGGDFYCYNNNLTTLEGCPKSVYSFDCENNNLTSLEGCPTKISGYFSCDENLHNTKEFRQYMIMKELRQ